MDSVKDVAVRRGGLYFKPSTKLRRWSVGLAAVFVAFMILNVTVLI